MSELGITTERLFNDPQLLMQYLDDIAVEIQIPYEERNELFKGQEITTQIKDVIDEVNRKDEQLKLLVGFIGLLMDKSEEKMRSQIEKLEKQDAEINTLKEENTTIKDEIQLTRQLYKDLEIKSREMEAVLNETELQSEGDKLQLKDALNKIQSLNDIKDKIEDLEEKSAKSSRVFDKLNEEKSELEFKIETLTKEKNQIKKDLDLATQKADEFDNLLVEFNKLDVKYDNLSKEFESERIEAKTKKNAMQAEITLLQEKIDSLQEELLNIKRTSIPRNKKTDSLKNDEEFENKNSRVKSLSINVKPVVAETFGEIPHLQENQSSLGNFEGDSYDNIRENVSSEYVKKSNQDMDDNEEKTKIDINAAFNPFKSETSSPTIKRKDIFEEFFSLSFQSALLNSPNFDDLAGTDMKSLYDEVTKKGIPFHKWYTWIVARLAHIYQEEIIPQGSGWIGGGQKKK